MTKVGWYAVDKSTPLESNKSLSTIRVPRDLFAKVVGKRSQGKLVKNQWVNFLGFTFRFY